MKAPIPNAKCNACIQGLRLSFCTSVRDICANTSTMLKVKPNINHSMTHSQILVSLMLRKQMIP